VHRDETGSIELSQKHFILDLLKRFGMSDAKPLSIPMQQNELKDLCKDGKRSSYQQLIRCLLFLSLCTRPDITFVVTFLSQFNHCHTEAHKESTLTVTLRFA